MLDSLQFMLDCFPEGAVLVRKGGVAFANALARDYLPGLAPGAALPACLPLPEPEQTGSGVFTVGAASYSYSCSGCGEEQLVLFRPAPQTALTGRQLDGVLRQFRELLGEVVAEVGPAAPAGREVPEADFSKSIHRLVRLTNNLEFLAQASGEGGVPFHPVTMDLAGLCRDVDRLAGPLLHEAGVELECSLSTQSLLIPGDPVLLRKLLLGLLSNAAAVGEGRIFLTLRTQGRRACITVSNSGPCPDIRHLNAMSQHGPGEGIPLPGQGAGLGLDIARHIAALHAGALMVSMGESAPAVTLSLPTGPVSTRLSVRTPILQRDGGLDPVLIELSDVLPARIFGLEGLD